MLRTTKIVTKMTPSPRGRASSGFELEFGYTSVEVFLLWHGKELLMVPISLK